MCNIVSVQGLQSARSLPSHNLIWDTVEPNQVEALRPDFGQWQPIASYAVMVGAFTELKLNVLLILLHVQ